MTTLILWKASRFLGVEGLEALDDLAVLAGVYGVILDDLEEDLDGPLCDVSDMRDSGAEERTEEPEL